MKNALFVVAVVATVCLILNVLLWHRVSTLEAQARASSQDFPLGETMGYLQRYADKAWYAGQAGNWKLARYYHDELAETAGGIVAAHVVKDGVPVSENMEEILPPALDALGKSITAQDAALFRDRYADMVTACNACHTSAKHPFVHITVPQAPPTEWNQDFSAPP